MAKAKPKKSVVTQLQSFTDSVGEEVNIGDYIIYPVSEGGYEHGLRYGKVTEIRHTTNVEHQRHYGRGIWTTYHRDETDAKTINASPCYGSYHDDEERPDPIPMWEKKPAIWKKRINTIAIKVKKAHVPLAARKLIG